MLLKGFKVTDKDGFSVGRKLRKNPPDEGIILYQVGKVVSPFSGMGPLAVFREKKDALRFRNHFNCYGFRIFECDFKKSLFHYLFDGGRKIYKSNMSNGSYFADRIKILREING